MKMSLSPSHCDESGHVARVDQQQTQTKKKKKTRRGTRGARRARSKWRPWSELTWEERRDLDLKGAKQQEDDQHDVVVVSQRRQGKRGKNMTVVVPVAPRLTKASIMDEREARTQVAKFEDQDLPETIDELDDFFARASSEGSTSDDEFDDAFNECMSHEYETLSKEDLIRLLLQRDDQVESLRSRLQRHEDVSIGSTSDPTSSTS